MLPGVPREMRGLFADELLPRLRASIGEDSRVVRSRTLRTTGISESQLAMMLGEHAEGFARVSLAYLPGHEGVDLRLTVRDTSPDEADRLLDNAAARLRPVLGRGLYGEGSTDLAAVVVDLCRSRGLHLAVAESCTGGMLGERLTAIPGSSDVVLGGVIAYSNAVKESLLGVRPETLLAHGAVSRETVHEMSSGVRARLGAADRRGNLRRGRTLRRHAGKAGRTRLDRRRFRRSAPRARRALPGRPHRDPATRHPGGARDGQAGAVRERVGRLPICRNDTRVRHKRCDRSGTCRDFAGHNPIVA